MVSEFPDGTAASVSKNEWTCIECLPPTPATSNIVVATPATRPASEVITSWIQAASTELKRDDGHAAAAVRKAMDRIAKLQTNDAKAASHCVYDALLCLGRIANYDTVIPPPSAPRTLPARDLVHLHPDWSQEWYTINCRVPLRDADGHTGEMALLSSFVRQRVVGREQQKQAGWSDYDVTMMTCVSSATVILSDVDCIPVRSMFLRMQPENYWGLLEGQHGDPRIVFSKPGESFSLRCGDASLTSMDPSAHLPLKYQLSSVANECPVDVVLTLRVSPEGVEADGRLRVVVTHASVRVGAVEFIATDDGTGWIDHDVSTLSYDDSAPQVFSREHFLKPSSTLLKTPPGWANLHSQGSLPLFLPGPYPPSP